MPKNMNKIEIVHNTGIILQTLQRHGEMSVKEICEITDLSEEEIFIAIGWLSCERKIFQRKLKYVSLA